MFHSAIQDTWLLALQYFGSWIVGASTEQISNKFGRWRKVMIHAYYRYDWIDRSTIVV